MQYTGLNSRAARRKKKESLKSGFIFCAYVPLSTRRLLVPNTMLTQCFSQPIILVGTHADVQDVYDPAHPGPDARQVKREIATFGQKLRTKYKDLSLSPPSLFCLQFLMQGRHEKIVACIGVSVVTSYGLDHVRHVIESQAMKQSGTVERVSIHYHPCFI